MAVEEEALRTGISLGMTLIDTSGNYGNGRSEQFLSHVIADQRDHIFLVSKVEADEVSGDGIARACAASLARLGTELPRSLFAALACVPARNSPHVVPAFEQLRAAGKIRAWGVSNFNVGQMEDLFRVPDGLRCATNQVPYSLNNRHIERDVLPWCKQHNMPVMAYSPLGGDNNLLQVTARWRRSAPRMVARPPRSRWPGSFAAATSSQFPNPALQRTSRKTLWRFRRRLRRRT